jgi:hypothetical protein
VDALRKESDSVVQKIKDSEQEISKDKVEEGDEDEEGV